MILTELPGQELVIEVFDKDVDMKDDFMGRWFFTRFHKLKKKDLKRWRLISVFVIQVEDKSERHHRISVHWSGENLRRD